MIILKNVYKWIYIKRNRERERERARERERKSNLGKIVIERERDRKTGCTPVSWPQVPGKHDVKMRHDRTNKQQMWKRRKLNFSEETVQRDFGGPLGKLWFCRHVELGSQGFPLYSLQTPPSRTFQRDSLAESLRRPTGEGVWCLGQDIFFTWRQRVQCCLRQYVDSWTVSEAEWRAAWPGWTIMVSHLQMIWAEEELC